MKKRRLNKKNISLERLFLLNRKKSLGVIVLWIFVVILHNVALNLFFAEEVFAVLASFIFPIYFIVSIIYTFNKKVRK